MSPIWWDRRAKNKRWYRRLVERQTNRVARARRVCTRRGHLWAWTCGSTWIDGVVVQSDSGRMCRRCMAYVEETKETSWRVA